MHGKGTTEFREAVDEVGAADAADYWRYWRVLNLAVASLQHQFVSSPHEKTYCMVCSGLRIDQSLRIRELERGRRDIARQLSDTQSIYETAVSDAIDALERGDLGAALNALNTVRDADAVELCRQEAP